MWFGGPSCEASDKMCNLPGYLLAGPGCLCEGSGSRISQPRIPAHFAGTRAPHGMERGIQNLERCVLSPLKAQPLVQLLKCEFSKASIFCAAHRTAFLICQHADTFLELFHSLLRNRKLTSFQRGLQVKSTSGKFKSTCKTPQQEPGLSASKSFLSQIGGIRESYIPLAVKFPKTLLPKKHFRLPAAEQFCFWGFRKL